MESDTIREGRRPDQTIAEVTVPVPEIVRLLEDRIVELQKPSAGVEKRRGVLGSKTVIAGTRIPTDTIGRLHGDGADEDGIIELYPDLTREQIAAALSEGRPRRATAG